MSRTLIRRLIWLVLLALLITIILVVLAVFYGWSSFARSLPELRAWHQQWPESEFVASDEKNGYTFDDYLKQEERVFSELDAFIAGPWKADVGGDYCRFREGSLSNPAMHFDQNWNRSFVWEAEQAKGGVLMLHGLSDSPYSMRSICDQMHADGYTVMVLRIPAHGTCPGALAQVDWQDWTAAVRVAAKGLRKQIPEGSPMLLTGFSNGGALSVNYALEAIDDDSLPAVDALVLISPMIGIAPMAKITKYHNWIAWVSGEPRAHWSNVSAEIDPFKYSSWPMNASVQAWQMTQQVEKGLTKLDGAGQMEKFPPVMAFQSVIDATVKVPKLMEVLFDRVEPNGSELLVFDVNRSGWMKSLINLKPDKELSEAIDNEQLDYAFMILTNQTSDSAKVRVKIRKGDMAIEVPLDLEWPEDIFSLAHAALPFPADDSIYGTAEATKGSGLPLGALDFKGESGVLMITDGQILRLRHNPFFPYMKQHISEWVAKTLPESNR